MKFVILTYAKDKLNVKTFDRLTEEAEAHGHSIKRVRYSECSMYVEHHVPKLRYRGKEILDVDVVIPWIIQDDFEYGMEVVRQFESMGCYVLNGSTGFMNACNKWRTAQILASKKIPAPNAYRANNYRSMYEYIDEMKDISSVIKISTGTRGNGVMLAKDKQTSKSIVGTLSRCTSDYILQEFVEDSAGVDVRAYVVGDNIVASMERRSLDDFRANISLGGKAENTILSESEMLAVTKTASALGLEVAGIDFLRTNKGPLIIEANTSGGFGIEEITGVNVAAKIIDYIEINAKRRNKKDKVGA